LNRYFSADYGGSILTPYGLVQSFLLYSFRQQLVAENVKKTSSVAPPGESDYLKTLFF